MDARRPPKRLPREYLEIWSALEEADRIATSRRDLARRLQVSTFTLQRILVDGDVPRLSRSVNTRVLHAWIRTLTRLACFFGKEPRRWIEMAGAPWSEATAEVSRLAERDLNGTPRSTTGSESSAPAGSASVAWTPISRTVTAGTAEIGLVADSPLAVSLREGAATFLEEYARRLILGVDPSLRPVFRTFPEAELLRALTHPGTPLVFGIGVAATVARRRRGLTFLSLPGWRLRLGGLRLLPGSAPPADLRHPALPHPDWKIITSPAADTRLLARAQTPAHDFLAGACGIGPSRLVVVDGDEGAGSAGRPAREPAAAIAAALFRESESSDRRPVFLVDDEVVCRTVRRWIEAGGESGWHCQELHPSGSAARSYPLAVAIPAGAGSVRQLLRAARDQELFGAAREETAQMYADFLIAAAQRQPDGPAMRLETFRPAGHGFRLALCRSLLTASFPGGVIERARQLLPATWHGTLEAAAAELALHPAAGHCRSCAASLRETHNRGVSGEYCRYCSDEHGRLRPREEVRLILARWLCGWQGEMPPEEAARRADSYMKAMPAWSDN